MDASTGQAVDAGGAADGRNDQITPRHDEFGLVSSLPAVELQTIPAVSSFVSFHPERHSI